MSVQAITWALDRAPDVPPHLVSLLIGLANHASDDGTGSYPGQNTLARYTRKDARAVRRDLQSLEELGLIRRGDQRRALHLPADRRPVVWDLAMDLTREPAPRGPHPSGRPPKNGGTPTPSRSDPPPEREGPQTPPLPGTGGSTGPNGGVPTPYEPSLNQRTTPPSPPENAEPPAPAEAVTRGEEADPGGNTPGRDALVAEVLALQPGWRADVTAEALEICRRQGRDPAAIRRAILSIARGEHGPTRGAVSKRLPLDGPWWDSAPARPATENRSPVGARCVRHPTEAERGCRWCAEERQQRPAEDAGGPLPRHVAREIAAEKIGAARRRLGRQAVGGSA